MQHAGALTQVKRIHEYKRQLLNVLGIIHRYDAIKKMTPEQRKTVGPAAQSQPVCAGSAGVLIVTLPLECCAVRESLSGSSSLPMPSP